ncbi:MAG: DUF2141 domain-containing protein [Bacteroidota bacterium]
MLYHIIQAKLLCALVLPLTTLESRSQSTLEIKVSDIETNSGKVIVALFQDEANWLEQPFQEITLATDKDSGTAEFDVPYGKYAVSIYQDLNANGELDRNFLGIPKEPVGFGNNHKVEADDYSNDREIAEHLWKVSEEETQVRYLSGKNELSNHAR